MVEQFIEQLGADAGHFATLRTGDRLAARRHGCGCFELQRRDRLDLLDRRGRRRHGDHGGRGFRGRRGRRGLDGGSGRLRNRRRGWRGGDDHRRRRRGFGGCFRAARDGLNAINQRGCRERRAPARHLLAHARQLIERLLANGAGTLVTGGTAQSDLYDQALEFVRQVAHGADAGHARSTLKSVERALERGEMFAAGRRRSIPGLQRRLRRFQQLAGFFAENGGDVRIKIDHRSAGRRGRRSGRLRLAQGLHGRQRMQAGAFAVLVRLGNAPIQLVLGTRNARAQRVVHREIDGVLIEVVRHCSHRGHAIGEQQQVRIVEADATIERLAQPVIERLGQPRAVARLGHPGTSRERVAGAIDLFGEHVRCRVRLFAGQPGTHRQHVAGGLARVDLAQGRIATVHGSLRTLARRSNQFCGRPFGHGRGRRCRRRLWRLGRNLRGRVRCGRGGSVVPGGERVRASHQLRRVGARRAARAQFRHELGQQRDSFAQSAEDFGRTCQRAVEQPVDQIFNGPRELAEFTRPDHPAAPFERVERTAHGAQRLGRQRILIPGRIETPNLVHLFVRFFGKQVQQLRIAD